MVFNLPKNITSLKDILIISNVYYNYLISKNVKFDNNNMPVFEKEWFLQTFPKNVIPFSHRKISKIEDRKYIVLCFFSPDRLLYPRLVKVFDEIDEYKQYAGVIGMDVSMTPDMDNDFGILYLQINLMFSAILGVNGIKIVFNTRLPSIRFLNSFLCVPSGVMCASSTLGTIKSNNYDYELKLLMLKPSQIIIYGKKNKSLFSLLDSYGIYWSHYLDIHNKMKRTENE